MRLLAIAAGVAAAFKMQKKDNVVVCFFGDGASNEGSYHETMNAAGLWGLRMMFTTESARECVEVAKGHMGLSDYKPNVLTRGLYYRGVD